MADHHRHPAFIVHGPSEVHAKLALFKQATGKSKSSIVRFLILKATVDDLPAVWRQAIPDDERELIALAEGRVPA